ncbi:hypothetical protein FHS33_004290 [Streptomyces calvus]|uniref:Uncharacterized protein n=1 Tax=Streptomyces calvus TaxID=67282 RepID=A0AA40SGQ7_9ACTN|nr:hypothetical protein [Streptomyces calvus]
MTAGPTSPGTASAATSGNRCRPARTACSSPRSASGDWAREPADGRWAAATTTSSTRSSRRTGCRWPGPPGGSSRSTTTPRPGPSCRTPSPRRRQVPDRHHARRRVGVLRGAVTDRGVPRGTHRPAPESGRPKASPTPAQRSPLSGGRRLLRHRPQADDRRVAGHRPRRPAPDLGESHRQPRGPQPRRNPGPLRRLTVTGPRAADGNARLL